MAFLLGTLGVAFLFRSLQLQQVAKVDQIIEKPDYSGIQINRIIKKDLVVGQGEKLQVGNRSQVFWSAWVYDPAKPANRGELIYVSSDFEYLFIESTELDIFPLLSDMAKGGKRSLIIPPKHHQALATLDWPIPQDKILLVEVRVDHVD